jgi:hypothetical protein
MILLLIGLLIGFAAGFAACAVLRTVCQDLPDSIENELEAIQ